MTSHLSSHDVVRFSDWKSAVARRYEGVVREYHPEEGWGVLDADGLIGGCWVSFADIDMPGYRTLSPGQMVAFQIGDSEVEGFDFVAANVVPL